MHPPKSHHTLTEADLLKFPHLVQDGYNVGDRIPLDDAHYEFWDREQLLMIARLRNLKVHALMEESEIIRLMREDDEGL